MEFLAESNGQECMGIQDLKSMQIATYHRVLYHLVGTLSFPLPLDMGKSVIIICHSCCLIDTSDLNSYILAY